MKYLFSLFCLCLILSSCEGTKDNQKYLSASNGNLNNVSVVADNLLWNDRVGEGIREVLTAPVLGLPQDEPQFNLRQIPTQVFTGFARRSRLVLKVEKTDSSGVAIYRDVYAKPQTVVEVKGKTDQDIIDQLNENSARIIDAFKKEEVKEKLRRINKSLLKDEEMESALGFTIDIPSAYRIAINDDKFFWVRKNLSSNENMALMFYEVPLERISMGDSTIVDVVTLRDEISATKIPGEDGIVMTTQQDYAPSQFKTSIDNKETIETRGMWRIEGAYMAGPFVNYAIKDEVNKRWLVAEGYVYAPRLDKRKYIFELEAIIRSINIK
ncbi:DUF4837 family protein [Winogradskyella maritima]|uniref:DUF4837 family protein n=1 Tax=Winogradskyella maritima TaxID=1517766 RepID=A0ABV8AEA5_9FLAO|nr:DUF4837 family protein [Winogradskyella maritima]